MLLTPSNLKTVRFTLDGLEEYLKKIEAAGRNVDEAVAQAVEASGNPVYGDMVKWAEKHKLTGATRKGLKISKVQRDGNRFYIEVGIDTTESKLAWHAVFVEYGSPTNAADPGIRKAFKDNRSKVIKIQKDILTKAGVPIE